MKKQASFGSRLAAGMVVVSRPLISWWPRHCSASTCYIGARATQTPAATLARSRDMLVALSTEWEGEVSCAVKRRAGSTLGLMCEHAVLEVALVDASFKGDPDEIERVAMRLTDNAAAQANRYAKAVKGFPSRRFAALMKDHITIFVGMVEALLDSDRRKFERYEARRDENAAAMAAFTSEWF